jgi:hypothetical protein
MKFKMVATPSDQRRSLVLAATFFVVAFAIIGSRVIASTKLLQRATPQLTDVESLRPYLGPLGDSVAVRNHSTSALTIHDPFNASNGVAPTIAEPKAAGTPRRKSARSPWVVTTVLLEGSRKSAIVNDKWVNLGDSLADGSRLTAVERDHVIVTDAKGVPHRISIQGGET